MLTNRLLTGATVVLFAGLTGCATPSSAAEPHQHMRDAKPGSTYPAPAAGQTVRKPLHDHREMK